MLLLIAVTLATQASKTEDYMSPAGAEYNAWLTCVYDFADRVAPQAESAHGVARAALVACRNLETDYAFEWARQNNWVQDAPPVMKEREKQRAQIFDWTEARVMQRRAGIPVLGHGK